MSQTGDKAIAAAGNFALFLAAIVAFFMWLAGEKKKQEIQYAMDYREGKDILVVLASLQHLEDLRRSQLTDVCCLIRSQRAECKRLEGLEGREALVKSYRANIVVLKHHGREQRALLCRTWILRKTQEMHARVVIAMRAKPDLAQARQRANTLSPAQAAEAYQEVEKQTRELLARLDQVLRENTHDMSGMPLDASWDVELNESDPDSLQRMANELDQVRAQIQSRVTRTRDQFERHADEMRFLSNIARQKNLQSQGSRLHDERGCGADVVSAADHAIEDLESLTDWVLQEMAEMEVEMACDSASEAGKPSFEGVDHLAEIRAAQEVSHHLAGMRQAVRRTKQ